MLNPYYFYINVSYFISETVKDFDFFMDICLPCCEDQNIKIIPMCFPQLLND